MVPKKQYGRANGMMSLVEGGPGVLAPLIAGAVLAVTIQGPFDSFALIMLIDLITFFLAIGALLIVHVPQPEKTIEGQEGKGNIWKEAAFGFQYIFKRPSLLGLQMIFFFGNLFSGIGFTLFAPMILARSDQNSLIFGSIQTAGAIGGIAGGVIMSAWGGFKRRVYGVLAGWTIFGFFFAIFGASSSLAWWLPSMVLLALTGPLINTSNQAIWQVKVAPDVQGRVFSARRLIAWFTQPIAPIIAGTLADYVMEPAMKAATGFSEIFGPVFGTGSGSGMGVLMFLAGLVTSIVGLMGIFIPNIRNVEDILPDHDQLEKENHVEPNADVVSDDPPKQE
jgi:hypothetical protein